MTTLRPYLLRLPYWLLCSLFCFVSLTVSGQDGLVKLIGNSLVDAVSEVQVVNNEVIICGRSVDAMGEDKGMVAKYDLNGNRIWETLIPISSSALVDFTVMPNGDIYAVGLTLPWSTSTDNATVMAKVDAGGNVLLSTTVLQTARERAYRILPKPDNSGLLVLGQSNISSGNTVDQGLILEVDFNLNISSRKRHVIGSSDTEWARNMLFNSPSELLVYGLSPALNGEMGLAVADANGNFTGENYRLDSPGTNRITPFSMVNGANNELYVSGSIDFPEEGFLMSLHEGDFAIRWAYRFPGLQRVFEITAPDNNGFFHASLLADVNGVSRPMLARFQETTAGLVLISAAYLDQGETLYSLGQITEYNQDLVYFDSRLGSPSGFGDYDMLYAYLNEDYESCISVPTEFGFTPIDVSITQTSVTQEEMALPEQNFFEQGEEIVLEQTTVCQGCGELIITEEVYDCAPQPVYTFTFDLVNNTAFPVTSVVVQNNIDPSQDAYFNLFSSPIPANGGVVTGLSLQLVLPSVLTDPLNVCFDVIFFTDQAVCCHFETCFELLPPDPCANISVDYQETDSPDEEEGECCYDLLLVNDFCDEYFTNVTTEIITPGVIFTKYGSTLLNPVLSPDSTTIVWDNPGGFLPLGPLDDMTICIGGILSASQVPQQIAVNWYTIDPTTGEEVIACTDTLEFFCQPCLTLEEEELLCDPTTGGYIYNFTVTNNSDHVVTSLVFENHTAGVSFEPPLIHVTLNPGDTYTGSIFIDDFGTLSPGDIIQYKLILFDEEGWCCHLDDIELVVPECDGQVQCDCSDVEAFFNAVEGLGGLTHQVQCDEELIVLTMETLTDCDQVSWTLHYIETNEMLLESSVGNEVVTFPILGLGDYRLTVTIQRVDDQGNPCPELITTFNYSLQVDCQFISVIPDDGFDPPVVNQGGGIQNFLRSKPNMELKAYPSPVSDILNVELSVAGQYQLEVFDSNNRRLWQHKYDLDAGQIQQLNVSQWASGVYVLRITNDQGEVMQQRFVNIKE